MGTVRRPGRVQRIAHDGTPLNAASIDIDARIGWLLAMSRLHHRDAAFRDGRTFVTTLGDTGFSASRSLVSRWESGDIPISYEGMLAYETALDLEPGQISSLTGYIRAGISGVRTKVVRPQLDPGSREFATRLDDLLDCAEADEARARDWQELGWHLAAARLVHLRGETWELLANRVIGILPRSVRVPYRQYSTAVMNMASVVRAQDYLVDAISDYLSDPDVQVVTNPLGLLDRLPTRRAAAIVLDILESPPTDSAFSLAVWLATQKVALGDFTPEERGRLDMAVLRMWRADPAKTSEDLAELIAELPEGLRSTLTNAADRAGRRRLGFVVEHGEEIAADKARKLAFDVAEAARRRVPQEPTYDEDRMLPRLIREVLFHRSSERRHLAALLLSASPFGEAVADEMLIMLGHPTCPVWMRMRAATTVRYLSSEAHRMRMLRFVDDPVEGVAVPIIQGLGHMTFTPLSDQAVRSALTETWSPRERAKLYALGMTGSPGLRAITKSATAPEWQRSAARWWIAGGPAVRS